MHNYEHKKLIEEILKLDEVPTDSKAYSNWISANSHLRFLQENELSNELAIYLSSEYTFVHSLVVPNAKLSPIDKDDLMKWSSSPFNPIASYVTGGGREDIWIERALDQDGSKTLQGAMQLIFARTFDGWTGTGRNYYELNHEYAHLAEIHWRPEKNAYCRFNQHGDIEAVVSVTTREDKKSQISLVSFSWELLAEYLAASKSSLVRMFDFTLAPSSKFNGWPNQTPENFYDNFENIFYHQLIVPSYASYARGVQVIRPRRPDKTVFTSITDTWFGKKNKKYVEFIAYDWRHKRVAKISTDPNATANYFNATSNPLPFELSPAFFRPEVLLKYKADRDKYTVREREISCRAAWYLKGIDVNEAGQIHAYICDLRHLPYEEQLHWLSFNEPPKANISQRAFINDFKGEWVNFMEPLQEVLAIIQHWKEDKVNWWTLRDEKLLDRVNTPLTESRDEWAESFMDLAKLVIEGFETKHIRIKLAQYQVLYKEDDKTIVLLEKLINREKTTSEIQKLNGLRTVQLLRSKIKGHVGGDEAEQIVQNALMEYETFSNHFRQICLQVAKELEIIEKTFS